MEHRVTAGQVKSLSTLDSPRPEFFRRISLLGGKMLSEPDLLAVAVALEPGIVRRAEAYHVRVELAGQHTRGHTTVDWFDRTGQEPNVNAVLELDAGRLWELLQAAVA